MAGPFQRPDAASVVMMDGKVSNIEEAGYRGREGEGEGGRCKVVLVYAWTEEVGTNLLSLSRTYRALEGLCLQGRASQRSRERER